MLPKKQIWKFDSHMPTSGPERCSGKDRWHRHDACPAYIERIIYIQFMVIFFYYYYNIVQPESWVEVGVARCKATFCLVRIAERHNGAVFTRYRARIRTFTSG